MSRNKLKLLFLMVTLIIIFCSQSATAKETYTKDERLTILNTPAISSSSEIPGPKYNSELEARYLNMSDSDFEKHLRESLANIIDRKNRGEKIKWNDEFVNTTILTLFPDLYVKIQNQIISKDEQLIINNQEV